MFHLRLFTLFALGGLSAIAMAGDQQHVEHAGCRHHHESACMAGSSLVIDGSVVSKAPSICSGHTHEAHSHKRVAGKAKRAGAKTKATPTKNTGKAKRSGRDMFYFKNCDEAWLAGHAPLKRGDDGYRDELDPDGDGKACNTWQP